MKRLHIFLFLLKMFKQGQVSGTEGMDTQDACSQNECPGVSEVCYPTQGGGYECACADDYSYYWDQDREECICRFDENSTQCRHCFYEDVQKIFRYGNKNIPYCKREIKECKLKRGPDGYETSVNDDEYVNIHQIGNGFNILLASPLEMGRRDKGHRDLQIFSPFAYVKQGSDGADCQLFGYSFPNRGKSCDGSVETKVYQSISDMVSELEEIFTKNGRLEESNLEISESENAQYTNAIAFGAQVQFSNDKSDSESASHCVDDKVASTTSVGNSLENNGQSTESDSESNTDSKSSSSTSTDISENTNSSQSHSETNSETGFNVLVFSHSTSTSEGESKSTSATRRNENSTTTGLENSKTNTKEKTSSEGWSKNQNQDQSNSKSISTNVCGEGKGSSGSSNERNRNADKSSGSKTDRSIIKAYKVPGYLDATESIQQIQRARQILKDSKTMITYADARCSVWSVKMLPNKIPSFSDDFKLAVKKLHYISQEHKYRLKIRKIDDTTFETTLDEDIEEALDLAFEEFVAHYGTHYFTYVEFGGGSVEEYKMTYSTTSRNNERTIKDCIEDILQDKYMNTTATHRRSRRKCRNPKVKKELRKSIEESTKRTYSEGSALLDRQDIVGYTQDRFDNPVPVNFELQPIITIFQDDMMSVDRISTDEGEPIDFKSIFSWFNPRYAILIGRCAALGNYRLAANGASCIKCAEHLVPSLDRTRCIEEGTTEDYCYGGNCYEYEDGAYDEYNDYEEDDCYGEDCFEYQEEPHNRFKQYEEDDCNGGKCYDNQDDFRRRFTGRKEKDCFGGNCFEDLDDLRRRIDEEFCHEGDCAGKKDFSMISSLTDLLSKVKEELTATHFIIIGCLVVLVIFICLVCCCYWCWRTISCRGRTSTQLNRMNKS